jgi:hypothetical protein
MFFLVTVKLPRNPAHNPRAKVTGACPLAPEVQCTDVTGEHHTYLAMANDEAAAREQAQREYGHVTRIETIPDSGGGTRDDLACLLRIIADGREEYITSNTPDAQRDILRTEAAAFRSAAIIVEGDTSGLWRLLPTWRLDAEAEQLAQLCDRLDGKSEPELEVTDAMVEAAHAVYQQAYESWRQAGDGPDILTTLRDAIRAALEAQEG